MSPLSSETTTYVSRLLDFVRQHQVHAHQKYLEKLPVEVAVMIIDLLAADELKALRLASKKFSLIGRRFLCRNINVTEVSESFERLKIISLQDEEIQKSVKHLTYMPFSINRCVTDHDVVADGFHGLHKDEWISLRGDRFDLARGAKNIHYLAEALKRIQPESISICPQDLSAWDGRYQLLNPDHVGPVDPAAFPNFDPISPGTHKIFNELERRRTIDSGSLEAKLGCATRSFLAILYSLAESRLKLKELEATTSLVFLAYPETSSVPREGLQSLTKIKLNIDQTFWESVYMAPLALDPMTSEWDTDGCWMRESEASFEALQHWYESSRNSYLGEFLTGAPTLEELDLRFIPVPEVVPIFEYWSGTFVRWVDDINLLGEHCWLHLKTLRLENFFCGVFHTESDTLSESNALLESDSLPDPESLVEHNSLLGFILQHGRTLKHVELCNIDLLCSTNPYTLWPKFFERLRESLSNGSLVLDSITLRGSFRCGYLPIDPTFPDESFMRREVVNLNEAGRGVLLSEWIFKYKGMGRGPELNADECLWSSFQKKRIRIGREGEEEIETEGEDDGGDQQEDEEGTEAAGEDEGDDQQ